MADLEKSISAAFNRGISLAPPSEWDERLSWFNPGNQGGKYNYWVEYWHNSGMAVNDLAYAFPYDDKFGSSTNLNVNNVGLARVLLNSWNGMQGLQEPTSTFFLSFPSSAQQGGHITLSANIGQPGLNAGTITFFIDGVAINSNDFSANPPQQPNYVNGLGTATIHAKLPALPDGSNTHTFTVTALYSGDEFHAPSIASRMLKVKAG